MRNTLTTRKQYGCHHILHWSTCHLINTLIFCPFYCHNNIYVYIMNYCSPTIYFWLYTKCYSVHKENTNIIVGFDEKKNQTNILNNVKTKYFATVLFSQLRKFTTCLLMIWFFYYRALEQHWTGTVSVTRVLNFDGSRVGLETIIRCMTRTYVSQEGERDV